MELINECSMRFAEDKDFRLLVSILLLLGQRLNNNVFPRLLIVSWHCSAPTIQDEESSAKDSKRYALLALVMNLADLLRSWPRYERQIKLFRQLH
jgi:hypothetical protein